MKEIDAKLKMSEMLELSDEELKATIIQCFNKQLQTHLKQMKKEKVSAKKYKV